MTFPGQRSSTAGIRAVAIVAAAGSGRRLGVGIPKAFAPLGDRPMLAVSLRSIAACAALSSVVIVAPSDRVAEAADIAARFEPDLPVDAVVPGGRTRQASVQLALEAVPAGTSLVVCHDAARPFASPGLFALVVGALEGGRAGDGAVPVVPSADTVKRVREGAVVETVPRDHVGLVQTPQAFVASHLREAYARAARDGIEATDDAMLLEATGLRVIVVAGEPGNFKITTADDLARAQSVIRDAPAPAGRIS